MLRATSRRIGQPILDSEMIAPRSEDMVALPVQWACNPKIPIEIANSLESAPAADADLVADLHARESTQFEILFCRYSRLVFGTAWRVLGNTAEAEDVVQEVFFYLYRKSEVFDPAKGSVKAWISQITVSRALDRKLYLARKHIYTCPDIESLELAAATDLEQETDTRLIRERLERALAELTQMQRLTIEFFYFEGLELREISQRLRAPLGSVRHYLYRGLERLRKSAQLHRLPRQ
jgi:RNA polymerase sigma-70 factor (ECF subfamily)